MPASDASHKSRSRFLSMSLGALGVVFGDIGTSPLYAIRECFNGPHAVSLTQANILGVISLVFWSLTTVVTAKYILFIMLADNKGEGGMFSLLELLPKKQWSNSRRLAVLTIFGMLGAALLYGEGVITPAISVLSAVEGLNVATKAAAPLVLPITCVILTGLFVCQKWGTAGIGKVFGPVMVAWFIAIGFFGAANISQAPEILSSFNPFHAVNFFIENRFHGFIVLGAVVMCITGCEALYADMGHFGRNPIRISWLALAFPCLVLNYLGQGAGLLHSPSIVDNPFYGIVPPALLYPMVGLATMATVIASQALISGAFSLTRQAVQLGFMPRVRIIHTSSEQEGQIYIPSVNWALMVACLVLTLLFKESSNLAAAYGISVTATMSITSLLFYHVAHYRWEWPRWQAASLSGFFLSIDLAFLNANILKFFDGGWITLLIAFLVLLTMLTWRDGRRALNESVSQFVVPLDTFWRDVAILDPKRVPGTGVFMSLYPQGTPVTMLHFFTHIPVLHKNVVILTLLVDETPYVDQEDRLQIIDLGRNCHRVFARYGFMETPDVPAVLEQAQAKGLALDTYDVTYFLGRETILTTGGSRLMGWRKILFTLMARISQPASRFFNIPSDRIVELGIQVSI
ncbi:MAG: KUP/HAK/KT family potassium transporter [Desulfovibrio sp.]|nr:KUP/HAK/KT family potassium transporter [Desulfovibrio sp.]MBI4961370.1 KUP/HAK/KT family potassium transporter [Desulfovibrio sp.]